MLFQSPTKKKKIEKKDIHDIQSSCDIRCSMFIEFHGDETLIFLGGLCIIDVKEFL